MKLATWNVNSLKVRLPHVLDWIGQHQPDVLCLQETKTEDAKFPLADIEAAGYHAAFSGQKTYNGVALLSRLPARNVIHGIADFDDEQKRVISATYDSGNGPVRVISAYVPNGQAVDSDKYQYKLKWLAALKHGLGKELKLYERLAILGDYNIAPKDEDVHDPKAWEGQVLVSAAERAAYFDLLELGLIDAFRLFPQAEKSFTWWDYRMMGFRRNLGLRIDHILLSKTLAAGCNICAIDRAPRKLERPSDHTPIYCEIG